ncbi:hypothetical protein QBC37DRAFT_407063, partial [Rhypophila decipiens]
RPHTLSPPPPPEQPGIVETDGGARDKSDSPHHSSKSGGYASSNLAGNTTIQQLPRDPAFLATIFIQAVRNAAVTCRQLSSHAQRALFRHLERPRQDAGWSPRSIQSLVTTLAKRPQLRKLVRSIDHLDPGWQHIAHPPAPPAWAQFCMEVIERAGCPVDPKWVLTLIPDGIEWSSYKGHYFYWVILLLYYTRKTLTRARLQLVDLLKPCSRGFQIMRDHWLSRFDTTDYILSKYLTPCIALQTVIIACFYRDDDDDFFYQNRTWMDQDSIYVTRDQKLTWVDQDSIYVTRDRGSGPQYLCPGLVPVDIETYPDVHPIATEQLSYDREKLSSEKIKVHTRIARQVLSALTESPASATLERIYLGICIYANAKLGLHEEPLGPSTHFTRWRNMRTSILGDIFSAPNKLQILSLVGVDTVASANFVVLWQDLVNALAVGKGSSGSGSFLEHHQQWHFQSLARLELVAGSLTPHLVALGDEPYLGMCKRAGVERSASQ